MEASLTEIVAAITVLGGSFGGALKFLLDRVGARQAALEAAQETEKKRVEDEHKEMVRRFEQKHADLVREQEDDRRRLEAERIRYELKTDQERIRWEGLMRDQISDMKREISIQEREIHHLRRVSDAYLRHITRLEDLMRAAGIQPPALVLPDYPPIDDEDRRRIRVSPPPSQIEGAL